MRTPRAQPSAESSSPRHGMRGPVTIKAAVKHPGEALPFHVAKGEGRSREKQNPREATGLAASHGTARWGGWGGSQHRLCIASSSPTHPVGRGPKDSQDQKNSQDKTKASGGEGGTLPFLPTLWG